MSKNKPINSVYMVALACASLVLFVNSLYTALIFGVAIVAVYLISISVVSMIEKVADKHVRFMIFALIASALLILAEFLLGYIKSGLVIITSTNLSMAIVPCLLMAIIPLYFEDTFTVKQYFAHSLLSAINLILMLTAYGVITEVLGYGTIAGIAINGFTPLPFFALPCGAFLVIASLAILFNMVRRAYIKKVKRFEFLVERYKIQIREIRSSSEREKNIKKAQGGEE